MSRGYKKEAVSHLGMDDKRPSENDEFPEGSSSYTANLPNTPAVRHKDGAKEINVPEATSPDRPTVELSPKSKSSTPPNYATVSFLTATPAEILSATPDELLLYQQQCLEQQELLRKQQSDLADREKLFLSQQNELAKQQNELAKNVAVTAQSGTKLAASSQRSSTTTEV